MNANGRILRLEEHVRPKASDADPPDPRLFVWTALVAYHVLGGLGPGDTWLLETYLRAIVAWPRDEFNARCDQAMRELLVNLGPDYRGERTPEAIAEVQRLLDAVPVELRDKWWPTAIEMWSDGTPPAA